jgi:hypothetical protein
MKLLGEYAQSLRSIIEQCFEGCQARCCFIPTQRPFQQRETNWDSSLGPAGTAGRDDPLGFRGCANKDNSAELTLRWHRDFGAPVREPSVEAS